MVVDAKGGTPRPVLSPDLQVPRWSPDGEWIAAARVISDSVVHLALFRPDGSDYHELAADSSLSLGAAAWTPDGQWLAAEGWDPNDDSKGGIYVLKASDGSGLRQLVTGAALGNPSDGIPGSFSPDGKQLVFTTANANGDQILALVNFDGTGAKVIGTRPVGAYPGFLRFGPAIYVAMDGLMAIFDIEGNLLKTIPAPGGSVDEARLSPDGRRFAFIYWQGNTDPAIASMKTDGTDLQIAVARTGDDQTAPDWQP